MPGNRFAAQGFRTYTAAHQVGRVRLSPVLSPTLISASSSPDKLASNSFQPRPSSGALSNNTSNQTRGYSFTVAIGTRFLGSPPSGSPCWVNRQTTAPKNLVGWSSVGISSTVDSVISLGTFGSEETCGWPPDMGDLSWGSGMSQSDVLVEFLARCVQGARDQRAS